jgi:hypothetical protein
MAAPLASVLNVVAEILRIGLHGFPALKEKQSLLPYRHDSDESFRIVEQGFQSGAKLRLRRRARLSPSRHIRRRDAARSA